MMKLFLPAAAAAVFSMALNANAGVVVSYVFAEDTQDGPGGLTQSAYISPSVFEIDFNQFAPGTSYQYLDLPFSEFGIQYTDFADGGGNLARGNVSGITAAPPLSNFTGYLTVPDSNQQNSNGTVLATVVGGAAYNYFGLFWGSIDSYNTLTFFLNNTQVASFTGSQLPAPADASGNQTALNSNRYVNFLFTEGHTFNRVLFSSNGRAFESDNHAYGTVPAPGGLALIAAGLLGLGLVRRRAAR